MEIKVSDQPRLLNDLLDGIVQAKGAASQLIHAMQDPRWMMIREALELSQEGVTMITRIAASKIVSIKPH